MAKNNKLEPQHVASATIFDNERLCFLLLCAVVAVVYFFISTDTPMHDMLVARYRHQRHDSAWFYDCGRAWMNGLTPYVDFADSKGPLLWLLYGIAYLISPHNFFGVYLINTVFFCLTACFAFKTIRLFTESNKPAFWMSVLMLAVYFTPAIMYDDKSEDIALAFVSIILYLGCRMLYGGKTSDANYPSPLRGAPLSKGSGINTADAGEPNALPNKNNGHAWLPSGTERDFFIGGLCFGAIALMKWSICFMTGMIFIYMLIEVLRRKPGFRTAAVHIGWAALGVVLAFAPFCIYLAAKGALVAFFDEFFYQTTLTIINLNDANRGHMTLKRADIWSYIVLLLSGGILAPLWLKRDSDFPIVVIACMLICTGTFARTYYYIPLHSMMIFTLLAVYHGIRGTTLFEGEKADEKDDGKHWYTSALHSLSKAGDTLQRHARPLLIGLPAVLAVVFIYNNKKWYNHEYLYDRSSTHERRCAKMCAEIIGQKHNARLLCYNIGNHGYGIFAEALPACKYFGIQGGATPRMKEDQDNCVEQRLADFIVMDAKDTKRRTKVEANGYVLCTNFRKWHHVIYRKAE